MFKVKKTILTDGSEVFDIVRLAPGDTEEVVVVSSAGNEEETQELCDSMNDIVTATALGIDLNTRFVVVH